MQSVVQKRTEHWIGSTTAMPTRSILASVNQNLRWGSMWASGVIVRYDEKAREVVGLTLIGVGKRMEEYIKKNP